LLAYVRHAIATGVANLWLATSSQSWRILPRPDGGTLVHADGPDPDRVLLVGAGIAVGYGVVTHNLGLAGHLARNLSHLTGRGASVQVIASSYTDCAVAREVLARTDLSRYDAITLTLGGFEAFTLMPPHRWRRELTSVLDQIAASAPTTTRVCVVGLMSAAKVARIPRWMQAAMQRHVERLDAVSRELCANRPFAAFTDFDPKPPGETIVIARATYAEWGGLIAPTLARQLDSQFPVRRSWAQSEPARQAAVDALRLEHSRELVEAHVSAARDLFGVAVAALNIIDGELQRTVVISGGDICEMPREQSFCNVAIRRPDILVVGDAAIDARVAFLPEGMKQESRFYAGYPIESPNGQRVGALCLSDPEPRSFSSSDAALLRQLALRAQDLLWDGAAV
jgi:GAF domain-containing protein